MKQLKLLEITTTIVMIIILVSQYYSTPVYAFSNSSNIINTSLKNVEKLAGSFVGENPNPRFQGKYYAIVIVDANGLKYVIDKVNAYSSPHYIGDNLYNLKVLASKDVLEGLSTYALVKSVSVRPFIDLPKDRNLELQREIGVDMFRVRELLGVNKVLSEYGVTGKGIKVAVVDTGIDYAHPDIKDSLTYVTLPDGGREPLVYDPDESQVLIMKSYNATSILPTADKNFTVLEPVSVNITAKYNYVINSGWSKSGIVKFGMTDLFMLGDIINIGILMVDPVTPGQYTRVYVDFNNNGNFTDDPYYDYNGDRVTIYDDYPYTIGTLGGFFFDFWHYFSYPGKVMPGWNLKGEYLSIFYDFYGHGTSVAGVLASRGKVAYYIPGYGYQTLPGIAPNATIIGIKGLWTGDVEIGMLWAAGFDLKIGPKVEKAPGIYDYNVTFTYTGQKRADIISNSWGISAQWYDRFGFGFDMESMLENGLTLPGFLNSTYPGIIITHAAGNGGPGYGTITSPGAASFVITVGASTLTHIYALFGWNPSGSYDEVISWSARAPSPVGEIKPDVVNVGAYGWADAPLIAGGYNIFGGTSMATPVTAGVIALMLEASNKTLSPPDVKTILQSTAKDLGIEPFVQASGRVDAYMAVKASRRMIHPETGQSIAIISSTVTAQNLQTRLHDAWSEQWSNDLDWWFIGIPAVLEFETGGRVYLPSYVPSFTSMQSSSMFLGTVDPGTQTEFSFTIKNLGNTNLQITNATALTYTAFSKNIISGVLNTAFRPVAYIPLSPSWFFNVDMARFILSYSFSKFDPKYSYNWNYRMSLFVFEWYDANHDGRIQPSELYLLNANVVRGTSVEVTLSNVLNKLHSPTSLILLRPAISKNVPSLPDISAVFTLTLIKYKKVQDTWITISSHPASIAPYSNATVMGVLTVPVIASSGVREGLVLVTLNTTYGTFQRIVPYSYLVVGEPGVVSGLPTLGATPYDLGATYGDFDWSWRAESGDWRVFAIKVKDPNAFALKVTLEWSQYNSSYNVYVLGPNGEFAGKYGGDGIGYPLYINAGKYFMYNTFNLTSNEPPLTRRVITYPSFRYEWYVPKIPAVFTIYIHQTLHGGLIPIEPFLLKVSVLTASQRLPSSITVPVENWTSLNTSVNLPFHANVSLIAGGFYASNTTLRFKTSTTQENKTTMLPLGLLSPGEIFTSSYGLQVKATQPISEKAIVYIYGTTPDNAIVLRLMSTYYVVDGFFVFQDWTTINGH
ncbi:MAG: S8 family serine peptidase [Thermoprotei archaeon]|jgi:subtilisin family serine protease